MFRLFIGKDFESKGEKKRKTKRKRESIKLWSMWNILTKDGMYCSYLKWFCSSKEKYYKSQDVYYLLQYIYIYIYIYCMTISTASEDHESTRRAGANNVILPPENVNRMMGLWIRFTPTVFISPLLTISFLETFLASQEFSGPRVIR